MRTEEEKSSVERGVMWESFLGTHYWADLNVFFDNKERELKDACVSAATKKNFDVAAEAGARLEGLIMVKEYILNAPWLKNEIIAEEKADREYKSNVFKHV